MLNSNAKKWVKALRAGEYKQGTGWLCKDEHYCCLGVACEVYRKEHELSVSMIGSGKYYDKYNNGNLPECVSDWLKITAVGQSELIEQNDDHKLSFEQIADYIEEKHLGLFEGDTPSPPAV